MTSKLIARTTSKIVREETKEPISVCWKINVGEDNQGNTTDTEVNTKDPTKGGN
jgi:hypothetical protein